MSKNQFSSSHNNQTFIIGGGIVGATLALKLVQSKRPVTMIDARPALSEEQWQEKLKVRDARVYALSLASINLLSDIGVWQYIEESGRKADYTQMHVWQSDGIGELKFADDMSANRNFNSDLHESLQPLLGSMVEPMVIEHAIFEQIKRILNDKELSKYLTIISGKRLKEIDWLGENAGYKIKLDNNESYYSKLIIGADGRGSAVRKLTGIKLDVLDYQQTAICCAIKTKKPHLDTARQAMLPTGTLALLPLADLDSSDCKHWQSVVWTLPTVQAVELLTQNDYQIAKEISFYSGYELGDIEKIESIVSFPLSAQQARTYVKPNLVLVGDAAHGVHPLAGQGLNLGLLDVIDLSDSLLNDYQRSHGKVWAHWQTLQRYERHRKVNNGLMMHSFSMLNWLFSGDLAQISPVQQLRSAGMAFVGRQKILMNWLSQRASGL